MDFRIKRLEKFEDCQHGYCCMTEVPTPWPEALCQCREWLGQNLGQHVEGYHLESIAENQVIGQLYYSPSETALIPYHAEAGATIVYCEWIQHRFQGQGLGHMLFNRLREDLLQTASKGIIVEATDREEHMHFRHYIARGFEPLAEWAHHRLLYFPLHQSSIQVTPIVAKVQIHSGDPVEIVIVSGFACPFDAGTEGVLLEVANEFGSRVQVVRKALSEATLQQYGAAVGIFINNQQLLSGGETEEEIRQVLSKELGVA